MAAVKGRSEFSRTEIEEIRQLLREKKTADRDRQKALRRRIRSIGFFISDFAEEAGFTDADFDRLLARRVIRSREHDPLIGQRQARMNATQDPVRSRSVTKPRSEALGHRVVEDWMGDSVETLEDLLRPGLIAVCAGINPAPKSVEAGHYYQGSSGQRFFGRLQRAGVLPQTIDGWEDDVAFEMGIGFTDVVKRPTGRESELRPGEFAHGKGLLFAKLEQVQPQLLLFVFKSAAVALFGRFEGNGLISELGGGASRCS